MMEVALKSSRDFGVRASEAPEVCPLTVYRFNSAPQDLREPFGSDSFGWLAHIKPRAADSFDTLLASYGMSYQVKDRRVLRDGSVILAGEFDLFGERSKLKTRTAR
jgi:hypothetical protein